MGYSEVQEFNSEQEFDKSENGEILSYKVSHQYIYPFILLSVKNFTSFLKDKGYLIKTLNGLVGKDGYMTYLKTPQGDLKLGSISQGNLLLLKDSEVFKDFEIVAYIDKKTVITGDLIYALA